MSGITGLGPLNERRDGPGDRRDGAFEPIRAPWITTDKVAGWIVAALLAYGVVNARVAVLESRVDGLRGDIREIRGDVKTLLMREPSR